MDYKIGVWAPSNQSCIITETLHDLGMGTMLWRTLVNFPWKFCLMTSCSAFMVAAKDSPVIKELFHINSRSIRILQCQETVVMIFSAGIWTQNLCFVTDPSYFQCKWFTDVSRVSMFYHLAHSRTSTALYLKISSFSLKLSNMFLFWNAVSFLGGTQWEVTLDISNFLWITWKYVSL